ncbi:MAG: twin-arginine translocase TatA/TatE family subunit [Verrucomicrobia bacterium]|nr:twin-arginine translocase TatA/TatE family subunit [Verrucomicrobiota bacterium]
MIKNFGMTEILLIMLVLVLLFGAKRIPELARSLGRSLSEFKKGRSEGLQDSQDDPKSGKEA